MPNGKRPTMSAPTVTHERLREIILEGNAKSLNEEANRLGEYFAQGGERERLSSSQIRNILDKLQRMRSFDFTELQLLRPLLAYAAGRHRGKVMQLQEISDKGIQMVDNDIQFENFKHFFEAIVAYHRYHGGK
ncbi:MAG: type III-A CRISPR-associated protein Csm2 [Desulfobacteraceae bacterium]